MSPYSLLFTTFFKIGAFTLGGGYAMLPIIEADVVDKYHWIKKEEFIDYVAVAQSCPGVFAINLATFVGYKLKGKKGALCTTLGSALPSFLIILPCSVAYVPLWWRSSPHRRSHWPRVPISVCPTAGYP